MSASDPPEVTHLIGLACGHFWGGVPESDEAALEAFGLFTATGDTAMCYLCGRQERIVGPVAKVLDSDESRTKA